MPAYARKPAHTHNKRRLRIGCDGKALDLPRRQSVAYFDHPRARSFQIGNRNGAGRCVPSGPRVVAGDRHLELHRPHVEERVLERKQRETRDAIARLGARPIVKRQLEIAERPDLLAVFRRGRRDVAGLIVDDRDAPGAFVTIEAVDEADERVSAEFDVGGDFASDHFEGRATLLREQPVDVPLRRALRPPQLQFELDRRVESIAISLESPLHVGDDRGAHLALVLGARPRVDRVKIFERQMERRAVRGGGRPLVFDRRANVPVIPFTFAFGIRVERRRTKVLRPCSHSGIRFAVHRFGEGQFPSAARSARSQSDGPRLERGADQLG